MKFYKGLLVAFGIMGIVGGGLVLGCTAAQLATTFTAGQEFCAKATADGPLVVALVDTAGVPVLVTNIASAVVADACKAWDAAAVPVSPPATGAATVAIVKPVS